MNQKGIANTYALLGGTQGWKNVGYPMDKSEEPDTAPQTSPLPGQPVSIPLDLKPVNK